MTRRRNIAWHGQGDVSLIVVPVERDTCEQFSLPIDGDGFIVLLECREEMLSVNFACLLYGKVIHNKCKFGWSCLVPP
jgi:hypothetical protein